MANKYKQLVAHIANSNTIVEADAKIATTISSLNVYEKLQLLIDANEPELFEMPLKDHFIESLDYDLNFVIDTILEVILTEDSQEKWMDN
jgi:hypothetical protein